MKLNGSKYAVRKVYIRTADSGDYYKVGWILNQDIDECMICCKTFGASYMLTYFHYERLVVNEIFFTGRKHHCRACGNVKAAAIVVLL